MMYHKDRRDFADLKYFSITELKKAYNHTAKEYVELQQYVADYEADLYEQFKSKQISYFTYQAELPKVQKLCNDLKNLESYMSEIYNLLTGHKRKPKRVKEKQSQTEIKKAEEVQKQVALREINKKSKRVKSKFSA